MKETTELIKSEIGYTTIKVPKEEMDAAKELLAKILQKRYDVKRVNYVSNLEVFRLLVRFVQYWFDNVPIHTALEMHDVVEGLAAIKRMDERRYKGMLSKLRKEIKEFGKETGRLLEMMFFPFEEEEEEEEEVEE